jgi:hypothetical protein
MSLIDDDSEPITVGQLRVVLSRLPDDMLVVMEIDEWDSDDELAQAWLRGARVQERCDEVARLYLYGNHFVDSETLEPPEGFARRPNGENQ